MSSPTTVAPVASQIAYPEWYRGGFPDIEVALESLFTPLLGGVEVVSWLPKPDIYNSVLASGMGYLRLYRMGGRINYDQNRDEPRVQVAALTRSRDASWELIEFARQVLGGYRRGAVVPGTTTTVFLEDEIVGPQLIPELIQDDRLVPITFELHVAKPKGLPNYRQAMGL